MSKDHDRCPPCSSVWIPALPCFILEAEYGSLTVDVRGSDEMSNPHFREVANIARPKSEEGRHTGSEGFTQATFAPENWATGGAVFHPWTRPCSPIVQNSLFYRPTSPRF
jgi:hypothetical protein